VWKTFFFGERHALWRCIVQKPVEKELDLMGQKAKEIHLTAFTIEGT
jgi:hypothetical protein